MASFPGTRRVTGPSPASGPRSPSSSARARSSAPRPSASSRSCSASRSRSTWSSAAAAGPSTPRCIALGYDVADRGSARPASSGRRRSRRSATPGRCCRRSCPRIFGFDERFGLVDDRIVLERLRAGFGEAPHRGREDPAVPDGDRFLHRRAGRLPTAEASSTRSAPRSRSPTSSSPGRSASRTYVDGFLSDPDADRRRDPGRRRRHRHDGLREPVPDPHHRA